MAAASHTILLLCCIYTPLLIFWNGSLHCAILFWIFLHLKTLSDHTEPLGPLLILFCKLSLDVLFPALTLLILLIWTELITVLAHFASLDTFYSLNDGFIDHEGCRTWPRSFVSKRCESSWKLSHCSSHWVWAEVSLCNTFLVLWNGLSKCSLLCFLTTKREAEGLKTFVCEDNTVLFARCGDLLNRLVCEVKHTGRFSHKWQECLFLTVKKTTGRYDLLCL